MGFFSDLKEDLSQAVNELVSDEKQALKEPVDRDITTEIPEPAGEVEYFDWEKENFLPETAEELGRMVDRMELDIDPEFESEEEELEYEPEEEYPEEETEYEPEEEYPEEETEYEPEEEYLEEETEYDPEEEYPEEETEYELEEEYPEEEELKYAPEEKYSEEEAEAAEEPAHGRDGGRLSGAGGPGERHEAGVEEVYPGRRVAGPQVRRAGDLRRGGDRVSHRSQRGPGVLRRGPGSDGVRQDHRRGLPRGRRRGGAPGLHGTPGGRAGHLRQEGQQGHVRRHHGRHPPLLRCGVLHPVRDRAHQRLRGCRADGRPADAGPAGADQEV